MRKFKVPRDAADLAATIFGGHNDDEVSMVESRSLMRRLRARVDLLAGSKADEEFREMIIGKIFSRIAHDSGSSTFQSLGQFELFARKVLAELLN